MMDDCMPCGRADGDDGTEPPKPETPKYRIGLDDAVEAGTYRTSFTDQQLLTRIEVMDVVIEYLRARGDSGIVIARLQWELGCFNDYLRSRRQS